MVQSQSMDKAVFRQAMSHYPSGITIITSTLDEHPIGVSCQAFHSLSLDPPMIILVMGRASTSWPRIRSNGRFCVNILSDSQAALARSFAVSGSDKFVDVSWSRSPAGLPVLAESAAWIDCELAAEYDGGDHVIVTGNVLDLGAIDTRTPLVFHRGAFRTMSHESTP
jgi:3-hydroxy-9,10-secoandrosta-1,3,5(10)-triene-9,17-dione monooxygenase reductase component